MACLALCGKVSLPVPPHPPPHIHIHTPAITATTLASFTGVTRSRSTSALASSVHMLAEELSSVLEVTLVLASDRVNRNCAAVKTTATGSICERGDGRTAWGGGAQGVRLALTPAAATHHFRQQAAAVAAQDSMPLLPVTHTP